ncbi:MAG TPA: HAD family hydrolase [Clostridiales bacterium]|nr:HAD family hydrolase [Clostridiales bacterium]
MSRKHPKIAIAYDFDGTLAKGNIQENSFIPDLGITKKKFWDDVKKLSKDYEMDEILAYMYLLITKAKSKEIKFDKKSLKDHGKNVQYFNEVVNYFNRINQYANSKNIALSHFIISSGTKEMIEGTSIAKEFDYIYASSFKFDQHKVPEWPALAINYTNKTQFLFRINKGIKNAWDNSSINKYMPENERDIPFRNIIYIGDGLTDVPCMKLVKEKSGCSIAVYAPNSKKKKQVEQLLTENRVNYVASADYSEKNDLYKIITSKIDEISAREAIAHYGKK